MIRVKTLKPVTLRSGKIELSKEQAARRTALVRKVKGNTYEIKTEVQMKTGEEFGLEEIGKLHERDFEIVGLGEPQAEKV